jgi:transposase IS200 family protein
MNEIVLMPWGLTRFHHSGQSHFVTFCCCHRRRLLITDASRRIFESALERVRRSFSLQVYGYVVMPEHVHLLLSEPEWDTNCPTQAKIGLEWASRPFGGVVTSLTNHEGAWKGVIVTVHLCWPLAP